MGLFTRSTHTRRSTTGPLAGGRKREHRFFGRSNRSGRKDPDRVAGGFKAALSNPNTTRSGRKHAKHELRAMGRGNETRVPIMTRIKRSLGIRSTPKRQRVRSSRHHHIGQTTRV